MISGILIPIPNANKRANPKNVFPMVATILSNKASPGDIQGDAIVPVMAPKIYSPI
jgi:hypothetical protein